MLQLLPQEETIKPNTNNPAEAIDFINSYIEKYRCETLSIDISNMNAIDACYVSTLCGAKHFSKYPEGKLNWKISYPLTKIFNSNFELENCSYEF